jgi:hypothetical protein
MTRTSTAIVALCCLAIVVAPAAAQTSPSGGIGNLPPHPASTTQGPDQAQTPPGGERGGDQPSDEKSPRASH